MPKKITNPLREGLPSKIYLLAYGDHLSGYEIARKIYGWPSKYRKPPIPPTAKVYGWLKELEKNKIVSIKREGKKKSYVTSNVDPLIGEVEKELKGHKVEPFSDFERHVFGKILDSGIFRKWIWEIADGLSFEYDIDAVTTIMSPVSRMALFIGTNFRKFSIERKKFPKTQQHFDKVWSRLTDMYNELERGGEKADELIKKDIVKTRKTLIKYPQLRGFSLKDAGRLGLFYSMPDSLLQKLAELSDPVDKVIAFMLEYFTEQNYPKARHNVAQTFSKSLSKLIQTLEDEFGGRRNDDG